MFIVYFDESGTHYKAKAFALAGYIATAEQWIEFEREWRDLLQSENISMFHRTDLECFHNEFSEDNGWNPTRRERVVRRAQGIIRRRVNIGISSSIIKQAYDEIITGEARHFYGEHYYSFAVRDCLERVADWIKRFHRTEPIRYVFEKGAEGQTEVNEALTEAYEDKDLRERFKLDGWSFEDKRSVVQLQAADLLAYETFKHMENQIVDGVKRRMRKSLYDLLRQSGGTPHHSNYWNTHNLTELVDVYRSRRDSSGQHSAG
jgi:hypothetical protein